MKKSAIALALAAAGLTFHVDASNVVYITGSTAFRSAAYAALASSGTGGLWDSPPSITTYGGSGTPPDAGASYQLFHGTINTVDTYVDCLWSGSEAGIASVASATPSQTLDDGGALANVPCYFLTPDSTVNSGNGSTGVPQQTSGNGITNTSPTRANLAFADTSQKVSLTKTPALTPIGSASGVVGIVPFVWVKNQQTFPAPSWYSNLVNVTHEQLQIQLAGPQVVGFFTGNSADTNNYVYTVGRNKGSGTRVNTLADTGYGIGVPVDQFSIGGFPHSGGAFVLQDMSFWGTPAGSDEGYESGGDVSVALSFKGSVTQVDPINTDINGNPITGWMAIGYLGTGDAAKNGNAAGLNWLTLNGVAESDGAIENGTYSMWGHEHLYGQPGISLTSPEYNVGTNIAAILPTKLGGSSLTAHSTGIAATYMHCDKGNGSDTAVPARF